MPITWDHLRTPAGDWYWWATLPNGHTAWVHDHSERKGGQPNYAVCATVSSRVSGQIDSVQRFSGPGAFRNAKNHAILFALQQRVLDKTYKIEANLPKGDQL